MLALAAGAAAIGLRMPSLARVTGALLILAGAALIHGQLGALAHKAPAATE